MAREKRKHQSGSPKKLLPVMKTRPAAQGFVPRSRSLPEAIVFISGAQPMPNGSTEQQIGPIARRRPIRSVRLPITIINTKIQ
jgi:hypothetical protein